MCCSVCNAPIVCEVEGADFEGLAPMCFLCKMAELGGEWVDASEFIIYER